VVKSLAGSGRGVKSPAGLGRGSRSLRVRKGVKSSAWLGRESRAPQDWFRGSRALQV